MTITVPQVTGNEGDAQIQAIFDGIRSQLLAQAPALTGTDNQIAYAADIRSKSQLTGELVDYIFRSGAQARVVRMAEIVLAQTATWWIEHRDTYGDAARKLVVQIATAHKDELMQIA